MDREPSPKAVASWPRALLRGQSPFASIAFALAAILLASMGASAWWATRTQRRSLEQARMDQLNVVGDMLAQSAEAMLAANELSSLRRIIAEAARSYQLGQCRVLLPDGQVVADASPRRITLYELPAQWSGSPPAAQVKASAEGMILRELPLLVPGRGSAKLTITAFVAPADESYWPAQAGIGAISVGALTALLLLHRLSRSRLKALGAIRGALLAREQGQTCASALEINPDWGMEAKAWNHLLIQADQERRQIALEKTRELLQGRRSAGGDLGAAFDAMSQGMILVDKKCRAKYANGAAAVLLQVKREDIVSAPVSDFIHDPRVLEAVRAAANGSALRRTVVEVQRNGDSGLLRFLVRPMRREDSAVAMIIIEDITQQRVAEEARNAFVAQATHELRTPLSNIRLYVEAALEEGEKDPAARANSLNIINQETRRLDRMVGDILSVAEIEAGTLKLKVDDVRLDKLFADLQADYAAQAQERQVELSFDLPPKLPVIQADRDKVAVALHNLLGNALKYTPAGGRVAVRVAIGGGQMVVEVSDTGIGINEEDRPRVFEKFYRARDRRVAETTGTGLGLAIAREVIRLHGGDITVQSELDKGSTFTLALPITGEGD